MPDSPNKWHRLQTEGRNTTAREMADCQSKAGPKVKTIMARTASKAARVHRKLSSETEEL